MCVFAMCTIVFFISIRCANVYLCILLQFELMGSFWADYLYPFVFIFKSFCVSVSICVYMLLPLVAASYFFSLNPTDATNYSAKHVEDHTQIHISHITVVSSDHAISALVSLCLKIIFVFRCICSACVYARLPHNYSSFFTCTGC